MCSGIDLKVKTEKNWNASNQLKWKKSVKIENVKLKFIFSRNKFIFWCLLPPFACYFLLKEKLFESLGIGLALGKANFVSRNIAL